MNRLNDLQGFKSDYDRQEAEQALAIVDALRSNAMMGSCVPAGTVFPTCAMQGMEFFRVDKNMKFFYDADRGKWLSSDFITDGGGRDGDIPSNTLLRRFGNSINDVSGVPIRQDLDTVIVGVDLNWESPTDFTYQLVANGVVTLYSQAIVASDILSDHQLDIQIGAGTASYISGRIGQITGAPLRNIQETIYYRWTCD
jgi:hypothetical protein